MDAPRLLYSFTCQWALGLFHILSIVSNAALNTSELVQDPDFRFLSPFLGHSLSDLKFPDQGLNLDPQQCKCRVLTTREVPDQFFLILSDGLLIPWLQAPSTVILEPKKIKSATVSIFPHLFAMKWWDQMPWSWLCFEASFFALLFQFHQEAL